MAIAASTHVLLAGPLLPAVPLVVRVTEPSPVSGMEEVAETTVVPVLAEVMTTVQLAVAPPPFFFNDAAPTEIYALSLLHALPISLPTVVPTAVTVMVSV